MTKTGVSWSGMDGRVIRLAAVVMAVCAGVMGAGGARGQSSNPVYVDDVATAPEMLARVKDHVAGKNLSQAVVVLQGLLDEHGERVTASATDGELFVSVRSRVHGMLAGDAELAGAYRQMQEGAAAELLGRGDYEGAERVYLMTTSGLEAALMVAQERMEWAQFEAARLCLEQLEGHPDLAAGAEGDERVKKLRGDAAGLMERAAWCVDRDEVWARAAAWRARLGGAAGDGGKVRAGANGAGELVWPTEARAWGRTPMEAGPEAALDKVLGKPLWTAPMGTGASAGTAGRGGSPRVDGLPLYSQDLRVFPTVVGDTVYVNDGDAISAWDRFTLTRRWRADPAGDEDEASARETERRLRLNRWRSGGYEEASTVTVSGPAVVAVTGLAVNGGRIGDGRVHAVDAATGRVKWSVRVDRLDAQLEGAVVRGPAVVKEGVVVVFARKYNTSRRQLSLYAVGLGVNDGGLLWVRLVGSVGSLPSQQQTEVTDAGVEHEGVVYRPDRLGVVGAYEVLTGRPVWVRRMPARVWSAGQDEWPWQMHAPVLWEGSLVVLSPERSAVIRLRRSDGVVEGSRSAVDFSSNAIKYMVRVGDRLATVSDDRVSVVDLANMERGAVDRGGRVEEPYIRGRVTAAGERLLVPVVNGVEVLGARSPGRGVERVMLDNPGNMIVLESQLVVLDDHWVHSYLVWELAEALLSERMRANPDDAGPAVTYAELAYRSGRHERILEAVDAAMAALGRGAGAGAGNAEAGAAMSAGEGTRRRLFSSMLGMVSASLAGRGVGEDRGGPGMVEVVEEGQRIGDMRVVGSLVERLGVLAATADERVSHLLSLGRLREQRMEATAALEAYQRILDDPALAGATWNGSQVSLRGELEAARRIEALVTTMGPAVYAAHEADAARELGALGEGASAEQLEALAARYPMASASALIWERAAGAHERAGQIDASVSALENGLRAAERGATPDLAVVGRLAGKLVLSLTEVGQIDSALAVLERVRGGHAGVELTDGSAAVDAAALEARLRGEVTARHRWADVGRVVGEGVQALGGWTLMRPVVPSMYGRVSGCVGLQSETEAAVWSPVGEGGELKQVWSRRTETEAVELLRAEGDSAYVFISTREGGMVEKLSVADGVTRWRTPVFAKLFPNDEVFAERLRLNGGVPELIETPADGTRAITDQLVSFDERTMVLVERSGRAAGFDLQTGAELWAIRTPVGRVFDVDMRAGNVVIVGDREVLGPGRAAVDVEPSVLVVESRTGRIRHRVTPGLGRVNWVRCVEHGRVVVGQSAGVCAIDAARGHIEWEVQDFHLHESRDAWVAGDRMYVVSADGNLWHGSALTGEMAGEPVGVPREVLESFQPLRVFVTAGGRLAMSSLMGLVVVDEEGKVVGVDALGDASAVVPPEPSRGGFVTLETAPISQHVDGSLVYSIHRMDSETARIVDTGSLALPSKPRRLALMDGYVVVSMGNSTVVLRAPAE